MSCPDCDLATRHAHDGFTAGCKGCISRGLAYIFLRKGESGRRLRQACEQAGVTPQQVKAAWDVDAKNPERAP